MTITHSSSLLSGAADDEHTATVQTRAVGMKMYNINIKNSYGKKLGPFPRVLGFLLIPSRLGIAGPRPVGLGGPTRILRRWFVRLSRYSTIGNR